MESKTILQFNKSSFYWKVNINTFSRSVTSSGAGWYSKGDGSKSLCFERFLFRRVIISKSFILKGHYLEDFYLEGSLFRRISLFFSCLVHLLILFILVWPCCIVSCIVFHSIPLIYCSPILRLACVFCVECNK